MAVYYVYSGAGGSNNGSSWANAFTTLTTAFATEVAGDTLYVAHDHAESAAGITLTSSGTITTPTKVVCVDRSGSVPPVSADRRMTAQVSSTTNTNITLSGCTHYDGIIFNCGAGSTSSALLILAATTNICLRFDNCSLRLGITGGGTSGIYVGGSAGSLGGTYVELNNTTMSFASTTHTVNVNGTLKWRNTPSALIGAAVPADLFVPWPSRGAWIECIGVDFSAAGSGKTILRSNGITQGVTSRFIDCKLDASVTKASVPVGHGAIWIDFVRSSATGNYAVYSQNITGVLTEETTIVRAGGASDGTTPIACKIVTTAWCNYTTPFECPPIAIWNDTTGSAVTATVEGIWGGGAVPLDNEIWLEVEYLGDASSPQGSFVNDGMADLLATAAAQTSSSETWGGSTTAFKLAVTFTAQQKGLIYCRVRCAKVSSTFYIDPIVTLSSAAALDGLSGLTGAWSMSRDLLTTFAGGSRFTLNSGNVSSLNDQSGNSRHLAQATTNQQPPTATANSRTVIDFGGVEDSLAGAAISNFISNNAGYIIASAIVDAVTTNNASSSGNDMIFCDTGGFIGFHLKNNASVYTGHAYNYDGTDDKTTNTSFPIGTAVVIEWKHEGGNILGRINGGSWDTVASGNTSTMTGLLQIGKSFGAVWTDYRFFEMAAFNTVPGTTTQNNLKDNFMAWCGA